MIFVVIYRSENGKENRVALVNAPNFMRALSMLGLSETHRDWVMFKPKAIKRMMAVKESVLDGLLSTKH